MPSPTRFDTEAALLGATGQESGRDAWAADTGNVFKWFPEPTGWVQQNRPADVRLVPEGGTKGQRLIVDPVADAPGFVAELEAPSFTANASNTTSDTAVVEATIPGGRLGPRGYVRCRLIGTFMNNAAAGTATLAHKAKIGPTISGAFTVTRYTITSAAYTNSGDVKQFVLETYWTNDDRTDRQTVSSTWSMQDDSGTLNTTADTYVQAIASSSDTTSVDTTADWTARIDFAMDVADASIQWVAQTLTLETIYLP